MRKQKISPGRKPKAPKRKPTRADRTPHRVSRDLLNALERGTWLLIKDKLGPRHACFARVTRDGKGNDVMVDLPRGADFVRIVIPIDDVITVPKVGTRVPDIGEQHWQKLAADAIRIIRELADLKHTPVGNGLGDDLLVASEVRKDILQRAVELERRMRVLAGQQEMFS